MSSINNKLPYFYLILGFIGFLGAAYLTILHYKNVFPPCSIAYGCETVLSSKFATIFEVPIALLGSFFYLIVLILAVLLLTHPRLAIKRVLLVLTVSGFIVSVILVYIQAFLLHAFCQYCLLSEAILTILLLASLYYFKEEKVNSSK